MNDNKNLICHKCNIPLEQRKTEFTYLNFTFNADLPGCPVCGSVFISEDFAKGKMTSAEMELEEK